MRVQNNRRVKWQADRQRERGKGREGGGGRERKGAVERFLGRVGSGGGGEWGWGVEWSGVVAQLGLKRVIELFKLELCVGYWPR